MKLLLASELTESLCAIGSELTGRGGRLLFIPTAARAEGWEPPYETHVRPFEEMGFEVEELDLASPSARPADEALLACDAVYVTGGNTFVLADCMRSSGFADGIAGFLRRGGAYVGSSAGAVVAGPSIAHAAILDEKPQGWTGDERGLALTGFDVLPHLGHPEFGSRVEAAAAMMAGREGAPCLVLRDGQVAAVDGGAVRIL